MRAKVLGGLVVAFLLLPGVAAAQTDDPCYLDPTSEECLGGEDDGQGGGNPEDVCVDPTTGELVDVSTGTPASGTGGSSGTNGAPACDEVDGSAIATASTSSRLAVTGSDLTIGLVGAGVLALGATMVLAARRRRSPTS